MSQDNIQALFEARALQIPDGIAVLCDKHSVTYRELNERSNRFAHYLRELGVQADTQVALCMERSIDLLVAMLGVLKAGAAYVPLDPSHPIARLLFVLNDNNNPILITQSQFKSKLSHYQGKLVVLDKIASSLTNYPSQNPRQLTQPHHLAYVIYTSGSTGKPKGVLIEHRSVVNYCSWFAEYSVCQPQQRIDFSSNYIFDMAVTTSIVSLMLGLTVVICPDEIKKNTRQYLSHLDAHQVNIIKTTPSYFKALLHEVKSNFFEQKHVKTIVLGGENLPSVDCVSWLTLYPNHILFNEYGPTEATVAIAQYKISQETLLNQALLGANAPIGEPIAEVDCYILNAANKLVASGEVGELHIGGICLARGYLNLADLTQQQFVNYDNGNSTQRLYKTGDLCRRLPNGVIECIGRVDHQVKIRGFRVEPAEIERCLVTHSAIDDAVVLAQKNNRHEKQLIAYYILSGDHRPPTNSQIRKYLEAHLPHYMIPSAFVRVDVFPMNANGKLDREALPVPQFVTNQHYSEPKTALEKTLAEIWATELGLKVVGIEDDFFELGGYSLSAARIISSITNRLGKELSLHDFYEAATIKKLSKVLRKIKIKKPVSKPAQTISHDYRALFPLSDFQLLIWLCDNFEPNAQKVNIISRKRVQGRLDIAALTQAFNLVFQKHDVLFYRVLRFLPAQRSQQNLPFKINEIDLQLPFEQEVNLALDSSMKELLYYYPWQKNSPLIMARLFHLDHEVDELQIGMSHLIADYISSEIVLADLSKFYLLAMNGNTKFASKKLKMDTHYREYVIHEQHYFQEHLDKDILFWQNYLQDSCLFAFPPQTVVKNMEERKLPYSTYLEIPEQTLNNLQQFCAENYVSINEGLTASLLLALQACCQSEGAEAANQNHPIFIGMVKSTRDNPNYDNTIGCFLRIESVKVSLNKKLTIAALSKQIHQTTIDVASYQQCSSLVKIACVGTFHKKTKRIRNYLIRSFTFIYTKIFYALKLNRKIFNLCGRLSMYERDNHFMININVQPNLIVSGKKKIKSNLFGLKLAPIKSIACDLLKTSNVFDVCFLRDENQGIPYIVISANLDPVFREQIAKELIQIINAETLGTPREAYLESV